MQIKNNTRKAGILKDSISRSHAPRGNATPTLHV